MPFHQTNPFVPPAQASVVRFTNDRGAAPAQQLPGRHRAASSLPLDVLVYLAIAALLLAVWRISRMGLFQAGDRNGYWIGLAGGLMVVLLFSYPLRKHFRFTRKWGKMKWWFLLHMVLGIGGPLLILLHSTFQVRSLNGAVALYSMLTVALSGVVGRFIYARVNRGLHGEKANLSELQARAGLEEEEARSRLAFAPEVARLLMAFEQFELTARSSWLTHTRQVFWLPLQQWLAYRQCVTALHLPLQTLAKGQGWSPTEVGRQQVLYRRLVHQYLNAVTRVAQFTAYERLFSLWHIAHLPFVYLMVICAAVHVVAVHAY